MIRPLPGFLLILICFAPLGAHAGVTPAQREALHKIQIGDAFLEQGAVEKACDFFKWAAKLAPAWWMPNLRLARCAELHGKPMSEIMVFYEKALKTAPDLFPMHMAVGRWYEEHHDWQKAEHHLAIAARVSGRNSAPWLRLARVRIELKRPGPAMEAVTHALSMEPQSVGAWHYRAMLCRQAGDDSGEEEALRRLLVLAPDPAPYASRLGVLFSKSGRDKLARILAEWLSGQRTGHPRLP